MEEITLRFEIVRLAVELGDYETIDIQCRKLRSLSLDERLDEIIDLLESKNFRQALYEMKHYHRSLEDEFFSKAKKGKEKEVNLFDGWESEGEGEEERTLDLDEILQMAQEEMEARRRRPAARRESSPARKREERKPSQTPKQQEKEKESEAEAEKPRDLLQARNHSAEEPEKAASVSSSSVEREEKTPEREEPLPPEESPDAIDAAEESSSLSPEPVPDPTPLKETVVEERVEKTEPPAERRAGLRETAGEVKRHPPISYIDQKYRNMIHQFPPLERNDVLPAEVEKMRKQIATEGYTEEEIEAFLENYRRYKEKGKRAEAAQVLLLAAATESQFAQFLLARELFRGEVLQQDHAESFTQINALADQNFAEAICDLGQLYEYGIGIGRDREMALLLYEEAAEMGVGRARKHYERLKNSRGLKGLFSKVAIPLPKKKS